MLNMGKEHIAFTLWGLFLGNKGLIVGTRVDDIDFMQSIKTHTSTRVRLISFFSLRLKFLIPLKFHVPFP